MWLFAIIIGNPFFTTSQNSDKNGSLLQRESKKKQPSVPFVITESSFLSFSIWPTYTKVAYFPHKKSSARTFSGSKAIFPVFFFFKPITHRISTNRTFTEYEVFTASSLRTSGTEMELTFLNNLTFFFYFPRLTTICVLKAQMQIKRPKN